MLSGPPCPLAVAIRSWQIRSVLKPADRLRQRRLRDHAREAIGAQQQVVPRLHRYFVTSTSTAGSGPSARTSTFCSRPEGSVRQHAAVDLLLDQRVIARERLERCWCQRYARLSPTWARLAIFSPIQTPTSVVPMPACGILLRLLVDAPVRQAHRLDQRLVRGRNGDDSDPSPFSRSIQLTRRSPGWPSRSPLRRRVRLPCRHRPRTGLLRPATCRRPRSDGEPVRYQCAPRLAAESPASDYKPVRRNERLERK